MRHRRVISAAFVLAALVPILVVGVLSADEVGTWMSTGFCPGGAMDQAPGPCGFLTFFLRVFLGGWASFVTLPAYLVWSLCCFAAWRWTRRREGQRRTEST